MKSAKDLFQPGQKVKIKNAKKYDSLSTVTDTDGIVDFIWADGRVAVSVKTSHGTGQMNVDAQDLVKEDADEEADLSKVQTSKLQQLYQLHRSRADKNPRSRASALRGAMELQRRGEPIHPDDLDAIKEIKGQLKEAPIKANYTPRHSAWFVQPLRPGQKGKYFALNDEKGARAYAAQIDGEVQAVDQFQKQMELDSVTESAWAADLDPSKKIVARGVKGVKSAPFTKKFKNVAEYEKWIDSEDADDYQVHQVTNESTEQTVNQSTSQQFSFIKQSLALRKSVSEAAQHLQYHVVSALDARVLASYDSKEQAERNAHGNPVVKGDLEQIGDLYFVRDEQPVTEQPEDQACHVCEHDRVCMDTPLFIKLLEYAREESMSDEQLHKIAENLLSVCASREVAAMSDFDTIIGCTQSPE